MQQWKLALAVALAIVLSAGTILNVPAAEPEPVHPTMLMSGDELPAHVHNAGPVTVAAYQAAFDHPDALAAVPCLCGCIDAFGHENNLDCYVESESYDLKVLSSHGLRCDMCHWITQDAVAGAQQGMTPAQLHEMIVHTYGR